MKTTRFEVVRGILLAAKRNGEPGFNIRHLAEQVESKLGIWVNEDTCRKEADMLKPEIPFVRAGKGVRRFIVEPRQKGEKYMKKEKC